MARTAYCEGRHLPSTAAVQRIADTGADARAKAEALREAALSSLARMLLDGPMRLAYFFALMSVAFALGPSLAHLLELPNKIDLDRETYFVVQDIYRGWALLGIVIAIELASTIALIVLLRGQGAPMRWAAIALSCLVGSQVLFWTFTFPANQATANWTEIPSNWQELRTRWEYSHAAAAVLNLAAMASLVASVLSWRSRKGPHDAAPA